MFTKEFVDNMNHAKRKGNLKNWISQLDGNDSGSDDEMDGSSPKKVLIINN